MLTLCYLPTAGRLTLTVIKARNLKAMDITGSSGKNNITRYKTMKKLHNFKIFISKQSIFFDICRPLCKGVSSLSRKKNQKEKNECQEKLFMSYLQRGASIRCAIR